MKAFLTYLASVIILLAFLLSSTQAATSPPVVGGIMPDITLPVLTDTDQKNYLGLPDKKTFKLHEIKAKVVIAEIFNMYCPYCQKKARRINTLYRLIESRQDLKDRVKLIGLGAGNSSFEVGDFKKKHAVPFPLFGDEDFALYKVLGKGKTPYFLVFKINSRC